MILEGIYYFGGKLEKGKLNDTKLRYFKPELTENKVVSGEFSLIKTSGAPPCARFGHTMAYLPLSNAIIIAGGRNDERYLETITPILNDINLFLLDQKVWLKVKYSVESERLDHICNSSMTVITDGLNYEKIIIFGGISNQILST